MTTANEAVARIKTVTEPGKLQADLIRRAQQSRPKDRSDFSEQVFRTVLYADGVADVVQITVYRSGTPDFLIPDGHPDDSHWFYPVMDRSDTPIGVSHAEWKAAGGSALLAFMPPI